MPPPVSDNEGAALAACYRLLIRLARRRKGGDGRRARSRGGTRKPDYPAGDRVAV